MLASLAIATVLWFVTQQQVAPVLSIPEPPTQMEVRPIYCSQAWLCTFDVVGIDEILGQSILVEIEGYWAPFWRGAWCLVEEQKGEKATTYLWELMQGAKTIVLVGPHKERGYPAIHGRLLLDGKDVAWKMIELGVASPPGVEVDWCAASKEMEV